MDEKTKRETGLSGHMETFVTLQTLSREMFRGTTELGPDEYAILQKTLKRCISDKPMRFPRKEQDEKGKLDNDNT